MKYKNLYLQKFKSLNPKGNQGQTKQKKTIFFYHFETLIENININ